MLLLSHPSFFPNFSSQTQSTTISFRSSALITASYSQKDCQLLISFWRLCHLIAFAATCLRTSRSALSTQIGLHQQSSKPCRLFGPIEVTVPDTLILLCSKLKSGAAASFRNMTSQSLAGDENKALGPGETIDLFKASTEAPRPAAHAMPPQWNSLYELSNDSGLNDYYPPDSPGTNAEAEHMDPPESVATDPREMSDTSSPMFSSGAKIGASQDQSTAKTTAESSLSMGRAKKRRTIQCSIGKGECETFETDFDKRRHESEVHKRNGNEMRCPHPDCERKLAPKGYIRPYCLKRHLERLHDKLSPARAKPSSRLGKVDLKCPLQTCSALFSFSQTGDKAASEEGRRNASLERWKHLKRHRWEKVNINGKDFKVASPLLTERPKNTQLRKRKIYANTATCKPRQPYSRDDESDDDVSKDTQPDSVNHDGVPGTNTQSQNAQPSGSQSGGTGSDSGGTYGLEYRQNIEFLVGGATHHDNLRTPGVYPADVPQETCDSAQPDLKLQIDGSSRRSSNTSVEDSMDNPSLSSSFTSTTSSKRARSLSPHRFTGALVTTPETQSLVRSKSEQTPVDTSFSCTDVQFRGRTAPISQSLDTCRTAFHSPRLSVYAESESEEPWSTYRSSILQCSTNEHSARSLSRGVALTGRTKRSWDRNFINNEAQIDGLVQRFADFGIQRTQDRWFDLP